jgi:hemin uptake protein HemP
MDQYLSGRKTVALIAHDGAVYRLHRHEYR